MRPENWKRVKKLLDEALAVDVRNRRAFLQESTEDREIVAEVESLLEFERKSDELMRFSAVEFSKDFFTEENENALIGKQIGSYRINGELGFGGMGAVFLASRADGKFEQKVALKLLKRELNTAILRRRFQQEREILASLDHPNIARLLDAGTTDDGVPFFAMEFVEGLPIDDYCRTEDFDLNKKLDLFRLVCAAVNFAHRNLVVHRDLKPSNILVTADGIPKLLDFGISKILSAEIEQKDSATVTKLGVMTPGYASPEQLQGKSVTTATDIYSLGVILYEILSGHRPFESKEGDWKEIFQAVIEQEPPRPSSVVSRPVLIDKRKTSENSSPDTKSKTLPADAKSLSGDLDIIVLKALRKEPERRYSSAENLAEDIHRHQRGLPVTARPNTFSYRAEKFFKRNKFSVAAGVLLLLAIFGGIIATLRQSRVARAERARAEKRFNDVRKLANSYLFEVYPEIENLEGSLKAREKILANALQYLDSLSSEASGDLELQAELATAYEKIGDVYGALNNSSLGNIQAGLDSYAKAGKLREVILSADPSNQETKEKLANNYYVTARTLWNNNQTADAEQAFEKTLKIRRELLAAQPESVDMQNRLAVTLIDYGAIPVFNSQTQKAVVLFDEAYSIVENLRRKEPDNPDYKKTLTRLLRVSSKAKGSLGDYEGGIRGLTQAVAVSKELARQFPNDFRVQRSVWLTDSIFCELYIDKQDALKAVEKCQPTIEFPRAALEKEPENGVVAFDLAISHFNLARAFRLAEKYTQTVEQCDLALEVMGKMSKKQPEDREYRRNLAIYETEKTRALLKLKQPEKAIVGLENVIEIMKAIAQADPAATNQYDLAIGYRLLAQAFYEKGDKPKAVENINLAITIIERLKSAESIRDADKNLLSELEAEKNVYAK